MCTYCTRTGCPQEYFQLFTYDNSDLNQNLFSYWNTLSVWIVPQYFDALPAAGLLCLWYLLRT